MEKQILNAVRRHYEANAEKTKVNIDIYLKNPAGIGEHSGVIEEVVNLFEEYDKNLSILDTIDKFEQDFDETLKRQIDRERSRLHINSSQLTYNATSQKIPNNLDRI